MKNDFDKQIKDQLEDSTSADAGFELDRKAVWNRIEAKQKTKIIPFKKWVSHAAAVIIGILLCLPFLFHSEKEKIRTVTIIKTIPSIQTINDTVFVVQNTIQSISKPHSIFPTGKKEPYPKNIAGTALKPKQEDNITTNIVPINNTVQVITKAEILRPKIKVLHLIDIENENAIPQARRSENYALFNKINIPARMDDKSETVSMIVSNQFFNSKN